MARHERIGAGKQPHAQQGPRRAGAERQQESLGQHHAAEAKPSRTERCADRHLTRLAGGSRQQQAGGVGRRD
jgi:hypothetical protein